MYRAGDLLKEVLARAGFVAGAPEARIYQVWDAILGADLAGRARLRDIDRGRLLVEVDHPAWMQLVQMRQRQILGRVQRRFPELGITRMHLVVSRAVPEADSRSPPAPPPAPPPAAPPGSAPGSAPGGAADAPDLV